VSYVSFASQNITEGLSGSRKGMIPPFAFGDRMELVADPALPGHAELIFNAARLDRSIALATQRLRRRHRAEAAVDH
jgi:Ala-tRNA(Pro) deacylase